MEYKSGNWWRSGLAAGDGNSSNPVSDNRMGEVYIRPGANTWGNGGSGNVVIQGATAVGSYVDRIFVNGSTGNVGFGTSAPTQKLDVNGNIKMSGAFMPDDVAGTAGQVLTSTGSGLPPTWTTPVVLTNIYNADGTLTGNRVVTQDVNTLAFTGSLVNAFSVDGTSLSVDAANHRVGIGTSTPTQILDVAGNIKMSGALMPDDVAGTAGQVLTSAGSGLPPTWTTPVVSTNIYNADGTLTGNRVVTQDVNTLAFTGSLVNAFSVDGTSLSVDAANHRVGIGTSTPTQILDVAGNIKMSGAFMPDDVAGTAGQVLTSAGSGLPPTWTTPVVSTNIYNADGTLTGNRVVTQDVNTLAFTGSSVNAFSVDGTTLSVDAANHRVGVGTTTPNAAVQVNGNISLSDQADHNGSARIIGHPTACVGNHGPLTIQAKSNVWSPYLASGGDLILAAGDGNSSNPVSDNRMGEVYIRPGANTYGAGGSGNVVIQGATTVGSYVDRIFVNGSNGNVGIGTSAPATKLHVNAVMRLEPLASAPVSASKGDMYFNGTTNKLMVYDGTTWQACW
ncbi:MAG: hypothetical protein KAZ36_10035 [Bacteroidales bacterium]|nr:hypothetical protein [Bacteroidales bacterium]